MSRSFLIYFSIIGVKNCIRAYPLKGFEENIFLVLRLQGRSSG